MSDKLPATMNANELFKEETFTDRTVGTITRLSPVTDTGDTDPTRDILYSGSAQAMTPSGPIPLNFMIEANSLKEACEQFSAQAQLAMEKTMKELQEMRRQQASQIVVPGQNSSKIQIP